MTITQRSGTRRRAALVAATVAVLAVSACGSSGGDNAGSTPAGGAATAGAATGGAATGSAGAAAPVGPTGEIKIWYSNNEQEVAWGKQVVAAWNAAHADQKVTGEEIPAGKSSEETIGAAITAGTTPCLIFNTSPAAVPQFQDAGGLVDLSSFPDGASYIETRTGADVAKQYQSADGHYYQLPWKSNPVMIFYNKDIFTKAGIDTDKPPLATYDEFLATAKKVVDSKAAQYAIYPSPSADFYQPWFDFYPMFAAETGGKQLIVDGKSQFTSAEGMNVINFWRQIYADKLAGTEVYQGDSFADGKAAMSTVGPWAIASYKGKVNWGVVPVPTSKGMPADQIHTFSDAKNVGLYTSCKNTGTAWDFLKFATSEEQDGKLLELTGQMPLRTDLPTTYADYFKKNPEYAEFASQAARTVEVPNVPNSVEIWQDFRKAWSTAVIFGKADPQSTFADAATQIDKLAAG
ncbi:ABC transporter substrate-binding protein [Nakamurella lactea]|uniref:ABC transporter substrate-binding protein n=1 Tax=Nakamurella lactea TaxID=459515 RepID=UPI000427C84D|nr:sugar ABC transporter substrate-binding protein [Nakamurella lactea]